MESNLYYSGMLLDHGDDAHFSGSNALGSLTLLAVEFAMNRQLLCFA